MEKQKETKNNNSRLSLYPLGLEEAAKAIVKVKPETKDKCASQEIQEEAIVK